LKSVKGIGWYIDEYGIAQLSLNLTNINVTPVHVAFDEASEKARERGIRVTGSEIVGLVPLRVMIDAANHYLTKQERSLGISNEEKIKIAVKSLGLDDLGPFDPKKRIIEYMIEGGSDQPLINMKLNDFAVETSSESPAPGGGSISAYCGVLGVSLGTMVANLSAHKRGWDDKWATYSEWAEKGMSYQQTLLNLVDEDTQAFNKIMDAFGLPKGTEEEKKARKEAIQSATKYAIEIPLEVARTAYQSMGVMKAMVDIGNPNSITDAGVGAMCARTAVLGAIMNVKINAGDLDDKGFVSKVLKECEQLTADSESLEKELRNAVDQAIQPN
ncbi:MAG: cyclodeaminase/cyclohydrolase family protein, partial [Bacteroidota bacterium]